MQRQSTTTTDSTKWSDLLREAVSIPGTILEAYSAFHGYSIGNQILARVQCRMRGIQPGPISTYPGWKAKGRQVRKGEKAITLCMPITCKRKGEAESRGTENDEAGVFTMFVYKPHWFVISQTDGEPLELPPIPEWDRARALAGLGITETVFDLPDGNVMGFARGKSIAISPLNPLPHKTTFHELAHVLLGHTTEQAFAHGEHTPKNLREVEAESVALICCESLGLPGAEYARGYIQSWLSGDVIPEKSAQKIFHAADQILRAGEIGRAEKVDCPVAA
ncbi:MAG TPA: ArdC-like ssDNA-binding domain-containing protein [Blastocatellia bacterium]|nr:ArdC-like ssDNA-binding domain-containing protein [Blastocatellia bacterium]